MADAEKRAFDGDASPQALDGSDGDFELNSSVDEKRLLRKLDLRLLPSVAVLYLFSFLDRSNVANARIEGLARDLHITGNQYLTGLTLFFVGYVVFEVPAQIVLKKTSPKFWLPTVTLAWGTVATLLGITQNLTGFFIARTFLGVAECGLFPGVVYYLSMWYKRHERQYRIALFFGSASLAGAFGGILAFGIAKMDGIQGQAGWRWIFIIEGCATVALALSAYIFIQNYPSTAKFITEDEREFIHQRLKYDSDATNNEEFNWDNVSKALKDIKCWLYGLAFFTMALPLYTLSLFLPTIILDLGYTASTAQLLSIPPYACAAILTVIVAILSERFQTRTPFIIGAALTSIIGYSILLGNSNLHYPNGPTKAAQINRPGVSYLGTFFAAAGIYPACALILSWPAVNVSGQTKRAVAGGMQIMIGNLGSVLGTQLYRPNTSPRFYLGHSFALGWTFLNIVVVSTLYFVLTRENKRRKALGGALTGSKTAFHEADWEGDDDIRWRFTT